MANKIEELPIFQRATEFCVAVTALLDRPAFRKNRDLREQISRASASITANMSEGFEQGTDNMFVKYLYVSKGSLGEVLGRLATARRMGYISDQELASLQAQGETLGRMLGGFIKYLAHSAFKNRGRHKIMQLRKNLAGGEPSRTASPVPAGPAPMTPGERSGIQDEGIRNEDSE